MNVRLPGPTHRTVVIGRTGTGKTVAGCFHLSNHNFNQRPWVIFDTKGDEMLSEIAAMPGTNRITLADTPGKRGLYYIKTTPAQMASPQMDAFLYRVHAKRECGLFFDEAFVLDPRSDALNTVLTQGRSLHLPTIICTQRPSWISKFIFSEADFFQIFQLNTKDDKRTVQSYISSEIDLRLQDYHSVWYDVARDDVRTFSPVPDPDTILDKFDMALRPQKRVI